MGYAMMDNKCELCAIYCETCSTNTTCLTCKASENIHTSGPLFCQCLDGYMSVGTFCEKKLVNWTFISSSFTSGSFRGYLEYDGGPNGWIVSGSLC